jgi:Xaa-Pro aminopeptidase
MSDPGVLIYGDSIRDADLYLACAARVPDPFAYLEVDGRRIAATNPLDAEVLERESRATDVWTGADLGIGELLARGLDGLDLSWELVLRMLRRADVDAVAVPPGFPLALADHLRPRGIHVGIDAALFERRRRRKDARAVDGILHAQRAAEAAYDAVVTTLRSATPGQKGLTVDGEPLTAERLVAEIEHVLACHGCGGHPPLVSNGPASAAAHRVGTGLIRPGEAIVVDIFPRHEATGFHADMTRTLCVGEPPPEIARMHRTVLDALVEGIGVIQAGVRSEAVYDRVCTVIEAAGFKTRRTVGSGERLEDGFTHALGHGIGLEIHEPPRVGKGDDVLDEGDVVAIEPGLYRPGLGGVRLEDLVRVTSAGAEVLTRAPYELEVC